MRYKSKLFLWLITLVSIIISLTFCELYLKLYRPISFYRLNFNDYQVRNDSQLFEPKPESGEYNSDGIRDNKNYSVFKPEQTYRIEVIGDSLAYGLALNIDNTFPKQLENKLNATDSGIFKYQFLNLGVPGYNIHQIINHLKEKGLKYKPDMVIYYHWFDDTYISDPGWAGTIHNPILTIDQRISDTGGSQSQNGLVRIFAMLLNLQLSQHMLLNIRNHTYSRINRELTYNTDSLENVEDQTIKSIYGEYSKSYNSGVFKDINGFESYYSMYSNQANFLFWNDNLKDFSDICEANKIKCILLITPILYTHQPNEYNWGNLHSFITQVAQANGIYVIDLTSEFEKYDGQKLRIYNDNPEHPNERGHLIISNNLQETIIKLSQDPP